MNKREKEVIQAQLNSEKAVLKQLEKQYASALNEINQKVKLFEFDIKMLDDALDTEGLDDAARAMLQSQKQSKIYQKQFQEALRGQVGGILDRLHGNNYSTIEEYLKQAYNDSFIGTMYDMHGQGIPLVIPIDQAAAVRAVMTDSKISEGLYNALGVDVGGLKKAISSEISRGIASGLTYRDIARNISNTAKAPLSRAKTIARTEGHRIQQASTMDAQERAKAKGADVVKQWDSALDGKTRPTHRKLDGQIREVDKPFEMDGKTAMFPGDFGDPAEDCNCRCVSLTRARWALDEDELQTLKDRAKFFGLDKTKDFNDFKKKYLKAAEEVAKNPPVVVGGVDCAVSTGKYGFGDGTSTGVKKTIDAITYTTPDGTSFVFPKKYNKKQLTMTPDQAISCWQRVPQSIRKQAQKTIEFVDYYNPKDSYWRKVYKNFPHSYATGGGKITFYRYDHLHNDDYVVRTYCHEAGHLIDTNHATNSTRFSDESLWTKAMADDKILSGEKSCTPYGENSNAEDFAESIAEYIKNKTAFEKKFPSRAAILATII